MLYQSFKRAVFLIVLIGYSVPLRAFGVPPEVPGQKNKLPAKTLTRCVSVPQRFNFLPNGYASSINAPLSLNCLEANFIISAKAGQLMVLVLSSPGATRFEIKSPDGSRDGEPVGNGGVIFNKTLTHTGDYQIRISKSLMAEPWSGQVILTAVIQPNL